MMLPNYWECPSCKRVSLVRSASPIPESENPESSLLHEEKHRTGTMQAYVKDIIYGGNDGIVSIFGGIAAATGTGNATKVYSSLVLGVAKWFAGALSMAVCDWLATDAEVDRAIREEKREAWEYDNNPEGEIEEMVELYVKKGVPEQTAREAMTILAKYKGAFVSVMMAEELGIPAGQSTESPVMHGLITFIAFLIFGAVPLVAYAIVVLFRLRYEFNVRVTAFTVSAVVTAFTMVGMACWKARVTGSSYIKSILVTVSLGAATAFVGWLVSYLLAKKFPDTSTTAPPTTFPVAT